MPPRTVLFEIATTATRPTNYVCRSCLAALTIQPPQQRGYGRRTKLTSKGEPQLWRRARTRPESFTIPREHPSTDSTKAEKTRPQHAGAASQDTRPKQGPRIKYFEKDPKTGKITSIPEIEDDGEPEPTLSDIAALGKRTMAKFDILDDTFKRLDALDGPLEKFLQKHGPPGAVDAYREALKSYDDPNETEDKKSPLSDLDTDAEPDPTVNTEKALADLDKAMSGSKGGSEDREMPELKAAVSVIQDAWSRLREAVNDKANDENNDKFEDGEDLSTDDMFQAMSREGDFPHEEAASSDTVNMEQDGSDGGISDAEKSSLFTRTRQDALGKRKKPEKNEPQSRKSSEHLRETVVPSEDLTKPIIWFNKEDMSRYTYSSLWSLRAAMLSQLTASKAAVGTLWNMRRACDDQTYKAFRNIRSHLSASYTGVNDAFWRDLWAIFSSEGDWNPHRSMRVKALGGLMLRIGAPLTNAQKLQTIDAFLKTRSLDQAIALWKRLVATVGDQETHTGLAFWELGIKLWCAQGDVMRAERAARNLLERASPSNPVDTRALLHLIQAYCTNPDTAEKGFELYRRMRDLATSVDKPMEIGDYDGVISLFLLTGHTDYALWAFTDMMFAGAVNLQGQAKLPNQVRNTFFFGKWLKRLIGAGDLDGAHNVLVFMQKNGVLPAAVQLNGLIGAYLRTGDAKNRTKAYTLAWAMIHSREAFVNMRRREASALEWPVRLEGRQRRNVTLAAHDQLDYGMVPRATTETFVIMATEYRERSLFSLLEELFVAHNKCEMPGDAMMMNELLAGIVAQGRGDTARDLFRSLVHEHGILPSTDTFAILFSSLPVSRSLGPILNNPALVAHSRKEARAIFADMMASAWIYSEKHGRRAHRPLSEPQAKLILHAFRKGEDYAGLSAALMGLRDVLEFRLTRGIVLELIEGVVGIERPLPRNKLAVVRATIVLQKFVVDMQARGQLPANATDEGMKDWKVLYVVLLQFYYQKMQTREREGVDGHTQTLLQEAQEEMGVTSVTIAAMNEAPPMDVTASSS